MTNDFAISPRLENNPVVGPNTKKAMTTDVRSTSSKALPIFMLVCFFKTMATISVPPLDAPILNRMADPKPGQKIAKISSSSGSWVRGLVRGHSRSNAERLKDISILA